MNTFHLTQAEGFACGRDYDDGRSHEEGTVVLEKGSRGVPRTDGSGTDRVSVGVGMVRELPFAA
jgi:hypothetical protein